MQALLRNINSRTFKTEIVNINKEINAIKRENKKIVEKLQEMDYFYMGCENFEFSEFIRSLLEYHPICEDTMFSSRSGKLVINKEVIEYTLDKAKEEGYEQDELVDLRDALNAVYKVQENEKSLAVLEEMKTRKNFSPKLRFDSITQLIISGDKVNFDASIIQKHYVLNSKAIEKIKFNEFYLRVLSEMVGISDEEYHIKKKENKGILTDMTYKDEVKYVSLLVNEHISNDKVSDLSHKIFNENYGLKPVCESEIVKRVMAEISKYIKQKGYAEHPEKVLSINSYEMVVVK